MNAAQFLAHFDRISDAPDAIPRLRRFILDFAVRGKLVEQDSRDEPASELLKRIQTEKAQSFFEGRARKSKDALAQSDIPFNAPADWEWVPFGEIVRIRTGKLDANAAVKGGTYPFFTCSQTPSEIDSYSFDTSAVLLAGNGDFNLKCYQGKFDAYQRTYVIEPLSWDLHFCFILMKSQISRITENQRGSAIPYLKLGDIADPLVPLPPLAEQQRIVAKVDELMALCDRLEAAQVERESRRDRLVSSSLNRLNNGVAPEAFRDHAQFYFNHLPRFTTRREHIQQLRQAILNLAVRGKLVPQDSHDELAAAQLLASDSMRQTTAKEDHRADADLRTLLAAEERWEVPNTWEWRALADLVLFIDYRGQTPIKVENGVRLITAKNVKKGFINLAPEEFLSEEDYRKWMTRGFPKEGDVLFTTEAPMGNAAAVRLSECFALAQRVICFRNYGAVNPDFLVLQLLAEPFQAILDKTATGLTAKGIKAAKLKRLPVAVPPLAEQHRIVAKVEELMALCDQLEAQLTTTQTESRRLLEAVLHEVLVGAAGETTEGYDIPDASTVLSRGLL